MSDFNSLIDRVLYRWVGLSVRYRWLIIPLLLAGSVLALVYTINNISVNTDTRDMLSRDLDWRQLDIAYETAFPMYVDNILVVIEAGTPDQAADAARYFTGELQTDDGQYREVFYPAGLEYLRQSGLLFLETDELRDLSDRLAEIQPFLGQLVDDQTLHGLFSLIEDAVQARRDGETIELETLLERITAVVNAINRGQTRYLSWQHLISGTQAERDVYREYIFIKPRIDYNSLLPGEAAVESVREKVRNANLAERFAAQARLTGGAALAYEELESVSEGAGTAALLALIIVTFILIAGLQSARLVIAAVTTLIAGLLLTAAMATATVGELNLISVAFAVLYIGLGVDFAIHFCLRFRELRDKLDVAGALRESGSTVGRSLFVCALTTAIGLYSFIPTDYRGIAELGWISGTGMFISLLVTLTLLPALLAWLSPVQQPQATARPQPLLDYLAATPGRHARGICIGTAILVLLALMTLPGVRFDAKTLNLQAPGKESVQTYRDLLADSDVSPLSGIVITQDENEALELEHRLESLAAVDTVRSLQDLLPSGQDAKLAIIDEMNFLLAGTLTGIDDTTRSLDTRQRKQALTGFLDYLQTNPPGTDEPALAELEQSLQQFRQQLEAQPGEQLAQLERSLLSNLPGRLQTLRAGLAAEPVDIDSLPEPLLRRWLSPDGWYLLEIQPRANLDNETAMRAFVDEVRGVTDRLIGAPVIQLEAADSVVAAFREAFILAFSVIALLLVLLLRSLRDTLFAMAPIALAALLTAAMTVVLNIPFNFANIIALPLLLGIGIDNSIHILHRYRRAPPDHGQLLRTSASRAILISGITTICSIGNLAFSAHSGTASMGLLLTLGISLSLISALILLPALLGLQRRHRPGNT